MSPKDKASKLATEQRPKENNAGTGKPAKYGRWVPGVGKWLRYGLLWTMLPLIAVILPPLIIRYSIEWAEIIPDCILVVFAVSVNLMSCKSDFPKEVSEKNRFAFWATVVASVVGTLAMFFMGILYFGFCSPFTPDETIKALLESGYSFTVVSVVSVICLIADTALGILLKVLEAHYSSSPGDIMEIENS